jgi:CBS domain containing-hemolysin-like protein
VDLLEDEDAAILPEEQAMIRRVFRLGEVDVSDAMTPLVDVDAVPETATVDDAITVALAGGHSRIVVYRDRIDNVAGVVDMFDLLYDPDVEGMVADRMGPVRFVPETQRADALLQDMRQSRDHFAVVVDEYGGSVGIVTIEDLLEEIIGEIQDERDEDEPRVRRLGDRQWRVPARTELDELEEAVSMDIPDGDYETVGGLVLAHMGRIPSKGESIDVEGMRYKAEEVSDRAILIVLATRL